MTTYLLRVLGLLVCLLFSRQAAAQFQQPEYLNVQNPSNDPIIVSLLPHGQGSPLGTQQYQIAPGVEGAIQLRGFQPFDILIERQDTYQFFRNKNVSDLMSECRATGRTDYSTKVELGGISYDQNGKKQLLPRTTQQVRIRANEDTVTIPFCVRQQ